MPGRGRRILGCGEPRVELLRLSPLSASLLDWVGVFRRSESDHVPPFSPYSHLARFLDSLQPPSALTRATPPPHTTLAVFFFCTLL